MIPLEQSIRNAVLAGERLSLVTIGGENAILESSRALCKSPLFGDVVEVLAHEWDALQDDNAFYDFVSAGLQENPDALALNHAIEALALQPLPEMRRIIVALDRRARDSDAGDALRVEAAAGVLRFAVRDRKWRATAVSAIQMLEDVKGEDTGSAVCHLAAVAWEQFKDESLIALLEEKSEEVGVAPQAAYERGVIALAQALEKDSFDRVKEALLNAQTWLQRSVYLDEDRRDARVYLLLIQSLNSLASGTIPPQNTIEQLRYEATIRYHWDAPRPGAEWLFPPPESELQWIPVVDKVVSASQHLASKSESDFPEVLTEVLKAYTCSRAIRPTLASLENAIRPAIEGAFIRERGLLNHLKDWLSGERAGDIDRRDAERLRENIERHLDRPGNS